MKRILIFGNSGSGKTWLASKLSYDTKKYISLDDLFWLPGGYNKKKKKTAVLKEIQAITNQSKWIVEGVFGHLLVELFSSADVVIFLDFPWHDCKKALLSRGSESSKQLDKKSAEENFQELLEWASDYSNRETKASYAFHNSLYKRFIKEKYKLSNRKEINDFVKQFKC